MKEVWRKMGKVNYLLKLDEKGDIVEARMSIAAHDKRPTLRRVWHPATLSALQSLVRPEPVCHACGREL